MKITKLVVLGKEIELPEKMEELDLKNNLISILTDIDPEIINELKETEYSIKIEGEIAVVYRLSAIFG